MKTGVVDGALIAEFMTKYLLMPEGNGCLLLANRIRVSRCHKPLENTLLVEVGMSSQVH